MSTATPLVLPAANAEWMTLGGLHVIKGPVVFTYVEGDVRHHDKPVRPGYFLPEGEQVGLNLGMLISAYRPA